MAGINELLPILHHIRVKLYPNYLPTGNGTFRHRPGSTRPKLLAHPVDLVYN